MLSVREQSTKVINGCRWISSGAASTVACARVLPACRMDMSCCRAETGGEATGVVVKHESFHRDLSTCTGSVPQQHGAPVLFDNCAVCIKVLNSKLNGT